MTIWQSRGLTIVLIAALSLLSIHVVNQLLEGARADLTADDLYSLSGGSAAILEKMHREGVEPVDVTLYFSLAAGKTLPKFIKDFITYDRYLRSLLGEYEREAKGKIRVHFVDPAPDTDEAQDAADYGLDGKLINQHGDLFYFGLVFETQTGSRDTIDFLWPTEQENVEYQISKKLHDLLWPASQKVGILSSLEVMGGASDPYMAQMLAAQGRTPAQKWISMQLLEESYDVSQIPADTEEISHDDYDLVVVIHPKDLSGKALWALDKWITTGGNTLVFTDPYSLEDRPPQNPQQPWAALQYRPASSLDPLFEAWGLRQPEDRFAADFELAVRRPLRQRGPVEPVIIDLGIDQESRDLALDDDHPILQGLTSLRFFLAGSLERVNGEAVTRDEESGEAQSETEETDDGEAAASAGDFTLTPLITTTASGNTLHIEPGFSSGDGLAYTDLNDAAKLRDRFTPGTSPVVIAYLLQGKLPSAYPDGADYPSEEAERPPGLPPGIDLPPPEDAEIIHQEPVPEEERAEATVMVFADVDFIGDQLAFIQSPLGILQAANDNHKVLLNAVDFLLGAPELMRVRSKSSLARPFKLFDEIEANAEKDSLERERALRADIETWEEELRDKQSEITERNAALFQKRLQEDVDRLNDKVQEANRELREIRQDRRAALERQEGMVRFSVLGWMPVLILGVGLYLTARRQVLDRQAKSEPTAGAVPASTAAAGATVGSESAPAAETTTPPEGDDDQS